MPAASASSLVVVPANPLRAKTGTAAATIALRRSSLSNLIIAIGRSSKRLLTWGQGGLIRELTRVRPSSWSVQLDDGRPPRRYCRAGLNRLVTDGMMKLYSYFRSSAAFRVRIAFNLKGLSYDTVSIHLQKEGGLNRKPAYRAIHPQMRVPALKLDTGEIITQSLAIIEYLDEVHPQPPLLPRDSVERREVA